jgi:hypothetical protein
VVRHDLLGTPPDRFLDLVEPGHKVERSTVLSAVRFKIPPIMVQPESAPSRSRLSTGSDNFPVRKLSLISSKRPQRAP